MRLTYVANPPRFTSVQDQAVVNRILERRARGPNGLGQLDRTLLHSPVLADGWNSFFGAIRKGALEGSTRELVICRVAALNNAPYEWMHHAPLAIQEGITEIGLKGLLTIEDEESTAVDNDYGAGLTELQIAVKRYTDAMTKHVAVPQGIYEGLVSQGLTEQQVVELTATIAGYNCVSRFLVALDVGEMNGKPIQL
ncbi:AhpD-like protein [Rhexocercosporidium sp. MPI-PUGE-AT-0058]|nr:AhpD-like protein [Rhexocercosporidium sp. MPI-PUGE-AT-0058]